MARKRIDPTPAAELPPLDGEVIAETQALAARLESAYRTEERERDRYVWQRIARRQSRELSTRMNQVADLMELQEFKAAKLYRGYLHTAEDGTVIEINTWEHYCMHIEGRSREAIDQDLANLRIYGPQLYEMLTQQGLGPATLRQWRGLPEDSHAALLEAAEQGDRDQLVDLAGDLLARERERAEEAARELAEARANGEAKDRLLRHRAEELDTARVALERARRRIETTPPEQAEQELRIEAQGIAVDIESAITTRLRPAFERLAGCTTVDHRRWMHDTAKLLQSLIQVLAQDHNVEDAPDEIPAWLDPEKFAAADAEITRQLRRDGPNGAGH